MPTPNPISFNPAGAAIQAGTGLLQTAISLVNAGKARKEAKELARSRPVREISEYAQQDLDLAESELANGGLSATAENAYNTLNNKQYGASISALLRGGGDVNSVADVYASGEEGRTRLALLTDQMRMNKIQNLVRSRSQMMEEQDENFKFNKWAPWADKAQANAEARQNAENGIWSGISGIAGGAMNYFGGKNEASTLNSLLKTSGGMPSMSRATPASGMRPSMTDVNTSIQFQPWQTPGFNPDPNAGKYVKERPQTDISYNQLYYPSF